MFTREKLNALHTLTGKVRDAQDIASEQMRTVKDRFKDRKQKLVREGKEIEVAEKVLWDEVFYMGAGCQAGKVLKDLHPQVFEAYRLQEEAAKELKKYCMVELGVDYSALTLSDYLKVTEGLFELLIAERGLPVKSVYPSA